VVETDMSFSVKLDDRAIEWSGDNLTTVFAQKKNLLRPGFWRMIFDILRFNKESLENLEISRQKKLSLSDLLREKKYSDEFRDWYLIPMGAAIWSTSTEEMLLFPAENFIQFCINHSLLQVEGRPLWRTVKNGTREYVKKMARDLPRIFLNEPVLEVRRTENGVEIITPKRQESFDKVILATHSDQMLTMLKDISPEEKNILSQVRYQPNKAYLHTDETLLPKSKRIWSAWNYISESDKLNKRAVAVSYLINKLQPLPFNAAVIVTLNPPHQPNPEKVIKVFEYDHPVFDQPAIEAQKILSSIQGKNKIYFAGAWCGHGFHEDGLKSGMDVAILLGAKIPW
jgi:predicted NAD/FAD-binding protein